MQSVPFLIHFLTQSQNCLKFWNVCTNILDESVAKIRLRIFFQNAIGSIFLAFVNKFLYVLKYHSFRLFYSFWSTKTIKQSTHRDADAVLGQAFSMGLLLSAVQTLQFEIHIHNCKLSLFIEIYRQIGISLKIITPATYRFKIKL